MGTVSLKVELQRSYGLGVQGTGIVNHGLECKDNEIKIYFRYFNQG